MPKNFCAQRATTVGGSREWGVWWNGWGGEAWLPHESRTIKGNAPLIRSNILSLYGSNDVSCPTKQSSNPASKQSNQRKPRPAHRVKVFRTTAKPYRLASSSNGSGAIQKVLADLAKCDLRVHFAHFRSQFATLINILLACFLPPANPSNQITNSTNKSGRAERTQRRRQILERNSVTKPQEGQLAISRPKLSEPKRRRNEARGLCLSIHDCAGRAGE